VADADGRMPQQGYPQQGYPQGYQPDGGNIMRPGTGGLY
jgi:penicillin-binding protein 1A